MNIIPMIIIKNNLLIAIIILCFKIYLYIACSDNMIVTLPRMANNNSMTGYSYLKVFLAGHNYVATEVIANFCCLG